MVRIRTGACGICATDLQLIAGWERTPFPTIPGHEWSGTIDTIGVDVDPGLVGKRCVAENVLADGGEVGFEHPGGYGEFLVTEARNVRVLPDDFPLTTAALIEPLAVVIRGLRRLRLAECSCALVSGDGPIGLLALMLLGRAGIEKRIVIGGRTGRLRLATELGATDVFDVFELAEGLIPAVRQAAGGAVPVIIEASGSASGIRNALDLVGREGQLLLLGDYHRARADYPWNLLIRREIELLGSNASAGAWDEAIRLAVEQRLPIDRLVSHTFPTSRFDDAFALVRSQCADVAKVVLEW